jgi:hypothetical protein
MGPAEAPLAPARPEAAAPAPAPAAPPANVWAPPASAAAPKARAPSGAAEEREQLADSYGAPAEKAARRAEAAKASAEAEARRLPRPRPSERKSAGPEQGRAAALRAEAAPGSVETRSFDGCPGERRRTVERAGDGTVLRYVREGAQRTIEHRYSPDGRLVAATVTEGTARRALPLDTPGLVRDSRDAGIDAPPRCGP